MRSTYTPMPDEISYLSSIIILVAAVANTFGTFLATKDLIDKRCKGLKRIKTNGWILIGVQFTVATVLIVQDIYSQTKNNRKENEAKMSEKNRDSIITSRVNLLTEQNRVKLYNDIAIAFQKQALKLDTVNKRIEKIDKKELLPSTDSQADPIFALDTNAISIIKQSRMFLLKNRNYLEYMVKFTSYGAASTNFNIDCYIFLKYDDGSIGFTGKRSEFIPRKLKLVKQASWQMIFDNLVNKEVSEIYLILKGTYTTIDEKKQYSLNDLYVYNIKTKSLDVGVDIFRDELMKKTIN